MFVLCASKGKDANFVQIQFVQTRENDNKKTVLFLSLSPEDKEALRALKVLIECLLQSAGAKTRMKMSMSVLYVPSDEKLGKESASLQYFQFESPFSFSLPLFFCPDAGDVIQAMLRCQVIYLIRSKDCANDITSPNNKFAWIFSPSKSNNRFARDFY